MIKIINTFFLILPVSPVCLPWGQSTSSFTGQTGVTVGWGVTEDGDTSDILRKVWGRSKNQNLVKKSLLIINPKKFDAKIEINTL